MIRILDAHVDRAAWLIDQSSMVEHVETLLDLSPQGRPRRIPLRTILIGFYLSIEAGKSFKSTTCLEVLRHGLSIEKQLELGTRWDGGRVRKSHVDYVAKRLASRGYTTKAERAARGEQDLVSDEELVRRQQVLQELVDDLLHASIIDHDGTGWFALDGTGLWAHSRSRGGLDDPDDIRAEEEVFEPVFVEQDGTDRHGRRWFDDADAATSKKTSKSGGREWYYGFVADATVITPAPGGPARPLVLVGLVVSPANTDVVVPSLGMLERLQQRGWTVTDITVDRHYSHKRIDRWADVLRRLGINQHLDLRSNDQNPVDHNGVKIIAGQAFCPALPDTLHTIPRPGFQADAQEWQDFHDAIDRRDAFAMKFHERPRVDGRSRVQCPAVAGAVGCPLRQGSVHVAQTSGLPVVQAAPAPGGAPKCCTNSSGVVALRSERLNKLHQPHVWGSRLWTIAYNLRTYVEGYFGSLKNPDTENLSRGQSKYTGLTRVTLGVALSAASCNIRHQLSFHKDEDTDHPLLAIPDKEDDNGWSSATA